MEWGRQMDSCIQVVEKYTKKQEGVILTIKVAMPFLCLRPPSLVPRCLPSSPPLSFPSSLDPTPLRSLTPPFYLLSQVPSDREKEVTISYIAVW
jgi:hypothetical protein